MLAYEQFLEPHQVQFGEMAAGYGFKLLATSDHFQRWRANEGHGGEALGDDAGDGRPHRRGMDGHDRNRTMRYHPSVARY